MASTNKKETTTKLFKDSLLGVIEDKTFSEVTVNDIVQAANMNRSSFYRYYDDKYSLLEEIENDVLETQKLNIENSKINTEDLTRLSRDDLHQIILESINQLSENYKTVELLLSANGDPSFSYKLRNHLLTQIRPKDRGLNIPNKFHPLAFDLMSNIIISFLSQFSVYKYQLTNEEIAYFLSLFFDNSMLKFDPSRTQKDDI